MSNDRIKVAGYSRKTSYQGGIEYRNFSPDLVGFQLASNGNTPLFTIGNFAITTNLEPKKNKIFTTNKLSNFVTLTDLGTDLSETLELLKNNAGVYLNLDKTKLNNYSLFGSLREFVRVSLENIITNWPAALYVDKTYAIEPDFVTLTGYTVQNYNYDIPTNTSKFTVSTNVINNQYNINYLLNGTLENTFNENNDLRNLTLNYESYCLFYNGQEYDIIDFVGAQSVLNGEITITVNGNPFPNITESDISYYIKPNKIKENAFYNSLDDFDAYILNRLVTPKYTSVFNFTIKSDNGGILYVSETLTWPTTDGYNLDYDTDDYIQYATKLLNLSENYDLSTGNLIVRFLVAESITDFDTTFVHLDPLHEETADQKMNKTLTIYGVEYDKINLFITGIKFANTVTYNKLDNTPDVYLKNLARVLGWELISSVLENNLLKSYLLPKESTYSGQSIGLTIVEADVELWRRLILNTPWIWKSKGTRKSIEFLFKFIGTPLGLIQFNEYIYLAENKIDIDGFVDVLELNNLLDDTGISKYPIDENGYPNPLPNTRTMYFQNDGLWYRETGGDNPNIDITSGNNPHVGPYDGGGKYMNQFRKLIPNLTATTVTSETRTITTANIFTNYTLGTFTQYSGNTFVNITEANSPINSNCHNAVTTVISDPKDRKNETDCGCPTPENLRSLSVCINKKNQINPCTNDVATSQVVSPYGYLMFSYYQYNLDGSVYKDNSGNPIYYNSEFIDPFCCKQRSGKSFFYTKTVDPLQSGYLCCTPTNTCGCLVTCHRTVSTQIPTITIGTNKYINFISENNTQTVLSDDGCNCVGQTSKGILSIPTKLTLNGISGYGCQLTTAGENDMSNPSTSIIYQTYVGRSNGTIPCNGLPSISDKKQKIYYTTINYSSDNGNTITNNSYVSATQQPYFGRNFQPLDLQVLAGDDGIILGTYEAYENTNENSQLINNGNTIRMITRGQYGLTSFDFNDSNNVKITKSNLVIPNLLYLVSDTEIPKEEFLNYVNQAQGLVMNESIVAGTTTKYYYSDFNLTSVGDDVYIYLIYNYVDILTYLKYAEAVGLTQPISVQS
jgi:hypothetical protein